MIELPTADEPAVIAEGDCLDVLRSLPDGCVDAVVTDPPAGIAFMGREWDKDKGGRDHWIKWMCGVAGECLRLLKPGGHAMVWALPRTSHWTATAWEDAGFEVRDRVAHLFGNGFPKSLDVSKAIDKMAGKERAVVGVDGVKARKQTGKTGTPALGNFAGSGGVITTPATDAARRWQGWGTALKPAMEDWWVFRKPLTGTVAENVLNHGTGAMNIDACRIPVFDSQLAEKYASVRNAPPRANSVYGSDARPRSEVSTEPHPQGRWPANVVHDGSPAILEAFAAFGGKGGGDNRGECNGKRPGGFGNVGHDSGESEPNGTVYGDTGTAARFFYCAKASQSERLIGERIGCVCPGGDACGGFICDEGRTKNTHPTVKAVELMRWLVKLIAPPGSLVLDPFAGSGTTGKACQMEGRRCLLVEREAEYVEIIRRRLFSAPPTKPQPSLFDE